MSCDSWKNAQQELLALAPKLAVEQVGATLWVRQWELDFPLALKLQKKARELVYGDRRLEIFICCSHPRLFTMGRGLQRHSPELKTQAYEGPLAFPLHSVDRGGELTFHGPNQWIFYPIRALHPQRMTLTQHIEQMLALTRSTLERHFDISTRCQRNPLGLWLQEKKVASVGVGVQRLVTQHGLALNLREDERLFQELLKLRPCGLAASTYQSLEGLSAVSITNDEFQSAFQMEYARIRL